MTNVQLRLLSNPMESFIGSIPFCPPSLVGLIISFTPPGESAV